MDQTLSLPHPSSPASPGSVHSPAVTASAGVTASDEEPESPGRSPRQIGPPAAGPDPLAEGMALMTGMVVALMAVLVPLAAVLLESQPPGSGDPIVRTRW